MSRGLRNANDSQAPKKALFIRVRTYAEIVQIWVSGCSDYSNIGGMKQSVRLRTVGRITGK